MTTKTIDLGMTWATAAQIIAAALENGTDKGREGAKSELLRMAQILDTLNEEGTKPAPRHDVITSNAEGLAYGISFTSEDEATAYAAKARDLGYEADQMKLPEPIDAKAAFTEAAGFFNDPRFTETAKTGAGQ